MTLSLPTRDLTAAEAATVRDQLRRSRLQQELDDAWRAAESSGHVYDLKEKIDSINADISTADDDVDSAERALEEAEGWLEECSRKREKLLDRVSIELHRIKIDERLIEKMIGGLYE